MQVRLNRNQINSVDRMLKAGFDRDTVARSHVIEVPEVVADIASGYICSSVTGRKW